MAKVEIDVDEAVEKLLAKKDRKIAKLEQEGAVLVAALDRKKQQWEAIRELRDKVVETAYAIDSYFGDDD